MKLRLPQYNGKDNLVLGIILLPFTVALNSIILGAGYFTHAGRFALATVLTGALFFLCFVLCGYLAVSVKSRLLHDEDTPKRLFIMMLSFVLVTGVFLFVAFHGYEAIPFFDYTFNEASFVWAYLGTSIINVFLTLVMEGIFRYNNWRENLRETETIRQAFAQSQLLGLKSQVNPHFLFNSLNTLSSLIQENEQEAETFLNEMSKVYRYMLRGNDEQLVTLATELKFLGSYTHLLEKRFGESLQVRVDVPEADRQKLLPPLSLQVLIENAFSQNVMSKASPLRIVVRSNGEGLVVQNTRRPKTISADLDLESGLDNLVMKYRVLDQKGVLINDEERQRTVLLPLLQNEGGPL